MNIQILLAKVKAYHSGENSGHDFSHIQRVLNNALKIGRAYSEADQDVIKAAALLHDVADHKLVSPGKTDETLAMMHLWLEEAGAEPAQTKKVMHICTNLSFSTSSTNQPLPIEGQIVQDADRLDALGAIGIARAFAYGGVHGREMYREGSKNDTVSHFYDKLLRLKDLMNTRQGRRMARQRHRFTESFLDEFLKEYL